MSNDRETKLMIVAGESSGDAHAARLVRAIRDLARDEAFDLFGAAGPEMRSVGVRPVVYSDELSVVGAAEIARRLPMFAGVMRKLTASARSERPDLAILVDFPEFNLRLAAALKKMGIRVVYYISPQLWAWRSSRLVQIKRSVDLLLTILPFESKWYAERGYNATEYVGNPLAGEVEPTRTRSQFCSAYDLDPDGPIVALLPGSRDKEVSHIAPILLGAAAALMRSDPEVQFVMPLASQKHLVIVEKLISEYRAQNGSHFEMRTTVGETYDALFAADAAAVTSGTATLEAALLGTPMTVIYKTSRLNALIFRRLINVDHFALVNLIAGRRIVTELMQDDLTPASLASELLRLMDPDENARMRIDLTEVAEKLGERGASSRAAAAVLRMLD